MMRGITWNELHCTTKSKGNYPKELKRVDRASLRHIPPNLTWNRQIQRRSVRVSV